MAENQFGDNERMEIGGEGVEVEADEVAFRCKVGKRSDGTDCIWWIRYFGMFRRGSSKVFLACLPDRAVSGSGQGGGGALSIEELIEVLRLNTDRPALVRRSFLHTVSAKSYKKMGPLR